MWRKCSIVVTLIEICCVLSVKSLSKLMTKYRLDLVEMVMLQKKCSLLNSLFFYFTYTFLFTFCKKTSSLLAALLHRLIAFLMRRDEHWAILDGCMLPTNNYFNFVHIWNRWDDDYGEWEDSHREKLPQSTSGRHFRVWLLLASCLWHSAIAVLRGGDISIPAKLVRYPVRVYLLAGV